MSLIEQLTAEQVDDLARTRDEWISHGLCTAPADRPAAEAALDLVYELAGLPPPRLKIWLRSPREGALAAVLMSVVSAPNRAGDHVSAQVGEQVVAHVGTQVRNQVWAQVRNQTWAQVRAQVWDQVWDQVGEQVWSQVGAQVRAQVGAQVDVQVRAQVWAQVWDQVRDQVWDQVRDRVDAQVMDQVWDQVRDRVDAQVRDQVWGQGWAQVRDQVWAQVIPTLFGAHDAGWLSSHDFFARHFALAEQSAGLRALATSCGWCWAFDQCAILTERPSSLCFDDAGRLHASHRPAVAYPDGFGVYAYKGVRMPADVMQDRSLITLDRIDGEDNAERRRVLIELFGIDRYIGEAGGEKRNHDNRWGTLWRRRFPEGPMQVLECVNGTPEPDGSTKRYWLPVPPNVETALEAVAWTYDMAPAEYARLELRT